MPGNSREPFWRSPGREGKQSYLGLEVLHSQGSVDCVGFLLSLGQEPVLGKEELPVYTGMPNSCLRKGRNVNSFL